jgi:uncharacterized phiE125 gp8 family phage protein
MALKLSVAPAIEPVSLATAKSHLRLDYAASLSDNLTTSQSIAPGDHVVAASYSLEGTAVDVLNYDVVVNLNSGTNGEGGTVAVKLQDSADNNTFADVTSGAFTTVTTANDNAIQEKAYSGGKQYLRAVATVAGATCDFGVDIIKYAPYSTEDTIITAYIKAARKYCEGFQNRAYITQTWEYWLDAWPDEDYIEIPLPPLSSVTSILYYDTDDTENTLDADEYTVDTDSEPGRVFLNYGESWPSETLRPHQGICITFVCGYGATAASVPELVTLAMLLLIGDYYENREAGKASEKTIKAVERLLWMERSF